MMDETNALLTILSLGGFGLAYGLYNVAAVLSVTPNAINPNDEKDEREPLNQKSTEEIHLSKSKVDQLKKISDQISSGSMVFLTSEYMYMLVFIVFFGGFIYAVAEIKPGKFYTTIAFVIGALTSILCGWIGMMIATSANYRTVYKAQ